MFDSEKTVELVPSIIGRKVVFDCKHVCVDVLIVEMLRAFGVLRTHIMTNKKVRLYSSAAISSAVDISKVIIAKNANVIAN